MANGVLLLSLPIRKDETACNLHVKQSNNAITKDFLLPAACIRLTMLLLYDIFWRYVLKNNDYVLCKEILKVSTLRILFFARNLATKIRNKSKTNITLFWQNHSFGINLLSFDHERVEIDAGLQLVAAHNDALHGSVYGHLLYHLALHVVGAL